MPDNNLSEGVKHLLTEAEAGRALGLSRSTLRRLWADGTLRPVHIGRSLRFPLSEIERFVSELSS